MDSFDYKLLEIMSVMSPMNEGEKEVVRNHLVEIEVRNRVMKILKDYFIFVPNHPPDYNPEESGFFRPINMYAMVNGKAEKVNYSSFEGMYMANSGIKISWDKLYRTQNEAIDSIISKRRRKPL